MKKNENRPVKIENIVASGSVADAIDLEFISDTITDCTFTKRKFPGAVYHMQDPKSAALIFESGKIVITGFRRSDDIPVALHNLLNILTGAGITCQDSSQVSLTPMVCSCDPGFPLNLVRITMA